MSSPEKLDWEEIFPQPRTIAQINAEYPDKCIVIRVTEEEGGWPTEGLVIEAYDRLAMARRRMFDEAKKSMRTLDQGGPYYVVRNSTKNSRG